MDFNGNYRLKFEMHGISELWMSTLQRATLVLLHRCTLSIVVLWGWWTKSRLFCPMYVATSGLWNKISLYLGDLESLTIGWKDQTLRPHSAQWMTLDQSFSLPKMPHRCVVRANGKDEELQSLCVLVEFWEGMIGIITKWLPRVAGPVTNISNQFL